jgi:hypothetical protein
VVGLNVRVRNDLSDHLVDTLMHASRLGKTTTPRTKAKFDEQIVAIARVENATAV